MAKDPAILFYTSDFLTGTMLMNDEQVGKYIRLLCLQHQKGRLTLKQMLKICLTKDEDIFDKFIIDSEGLYYNERLDNEINKRKKHNPYKIASATLGGLISAQNLNKKQVAFIKDRFNIKDFLNIDSNDEIKKEVKEWLSKCLTIYEDENEDENEKSIKNKKVNINFDIFWNEYDKKVGNKESIEKKWNNLTDEKRQLIINHIKKYKIAQPDKQYRRNPETYLNQQGWEDEIIERNSKQTTFRPIETPMNLI